MHTDKLNVENIKSLYWDKAFNIAEIAGKLGVSFWSLYNFMHKNNISRRSHSEANYVVNKNKPQFKIKENLSISEQKLKVAGIMLYWSEGTLKGQTLDFVNSNPYMVQLFLKFLRGICRISEQRLRVYLYAYSYQDLKKIKNYWSKVTRITLSRFSKPYIREGNPNLSKRRLPYGLVHIRYNDKKLLGLITSWIEEYKNSSLLGAGTQVAKGGRLCKSSVPPKGGMEK